MIPATELITRSQRGATYPVEKMILIAAAIVIALTVGGFLLYRTLTQTERHTPVEVSGGFHNSQTCDEVTDEIVIQNKVWHHTDNGITTELYRLSRAIDEKEMGLDFTGDGDTDDFIPLLEDISETTLAAVTGRDKLGGLLIRYYNRSSLTVLPLPSLSAEVVKKRQSDTVYLYGFGEDIGIAIPARLEGGFINSPDNNSLLNGQLGASYYIDAPDTVNIRSQSLAAALNPTGDISTKGATDLSFKAKLSISKSSCWTIRLSTRS